MAKNSKDVYGAQGATSLLAFDPTGERAKALRWVLGIAEPEALPGLNAAVTAMRELDEQRAEAA